MLLCPILLSALFGIIQTKPAPVFADVSFGNGGPYRFLVDTAAQSTLIDPTLAAQLGLVPKFRIEVVMQHGSRLAPGLNVSTLRVGNRQLPETEVLFYDMAEARRLYPNVQGILGLNALAHFDFLMSPATAVLDPAAQKPETGEVIPFEIVEGRMVVKAKMGKETLALALDSGATHAVLFRTPKAMAATPPVASQFVTLDGARRTVPTTWTAAMSFGQTLTLKTLPAAIVHRPGTAIQGLLPASVFEQIYVDHIRRELVVVRAAAPTRR
ncbi:MAG: aspartyl protease family protein [Bryobacterales bacterium]|nr:aspartyl protease family protein [Bryobacterales bacterium]